ncbi:hypothetical protein AgCh_031845 [Apium graveolens]
MNKTKLPIRERIGNVPQFPVGVDVAVAEVVTINRLGHSLSPPFEFMRQKVDYIHWNFSDMVDGIIDAGFEGHLEKAEIYLQVVVLL